MRASRKLGLAALLVFNLSACVAPTHRYQVTRESQLKAVARDLYEGIASLPHGMILSELSEPLREPDLQAQESPGQERR